MFLIALAPLFSIAQDSPDQWDAALFLPTKAIQDIMDQYNGTVIKIPLDLVPDVELKLARTQITGLYGGTTVSIDIAVGLLGGSSIGHLTATGTIRFDKFERRTDGMPTAKLDLNLDKLLPGIGVAKFSLGGIAERLVVKGFLTRLSEYLSFAVPVPLDVDGKGGFDDDISFKCDDKNGEVRVHITAPAVTVSKKLTDLVVIFIPQGMWLCAKVDGAGQSVHTDLSPAQRWPKYAEMAPSENARLLIRGAFLVDALDQFKAQNSGLLTATAKGKGHKGALLANKEVTVWLKNDNEGAQLTFDPKARWVSEGLVVDCTYEATANADIGFNLRIPGGSIGTSVGILGGSLGSIHGTFYPALIKGNPSTGKFQACALVLNSLFIQDNQAEEIKTVAETDGTFKTKLPFNAWLRSGFAPRIVATASLPIPADVLPDFPLLTNEPWHIDFQKSLDLPAGWTLSPPPGGFPTHLMFVPQNAETEANGYRVDFSASLKKLEPDEVDQCKDAIHSLLGENSKQVLGLGKMVVSIEGIGPNNDLVKAIKAFIGAMTAAYNEARKAGENVSETLAKADKDFQAEMARVPQNLERAPRNVERAVGKFSAEKLGIKGVKLPKKLSDIHPPSTGQLPAPVRKLFHMR